MGKKKEVLDQMDMAIGMFRETLKDRPDLQSMDAVTMATAFGYVAFRMMILHHGYEEARPLFLKLMASVADDERMKHVTTH